jgi:hypothetical protein
VYIIPTWVHLYTYIYVLHFSQEEKHARNAWRDEFNRNNPILQAGTKKLTYTTTTFATQSGDKVERLKAVTERIPYQKGSKSAYKKAYFEERFKSKSVFTLFFGEDWDLISRIAADPAHELHNLVKDLLKLVLGIGM